MKMMKTSKVIVAWLWVISQLNLDNFLFRSLFPKGFLPIVSAHSGSRLIVHSPESLRNASSTGAFTHEEAMFGKRLHGTSVIQPLYYADSDYCLNGYYDGDIQYYPTSPIQSSAPFLLMVNRGGNCNFVQKVRNAQHMGAAGVIIADTVCVCRDTLCVNQTGPDVRCQRREPVMAGDGSGGHDISIPSFLLGKRDADLFKKVIIEQQTTVRVEMRFPPLLETGKRPGGYVTEPSIVTIDLWTSPGERLTSPELIANFQPVLLAFAAHIQFNLHTVLFDGSQIGCTTPTPGGSSSTTVSEDCKHVCTNQGRYCANSFDQWFLDRDIMETSHVNGADVVKESLRQLCIWSQEQPSAAISNNSTAAWASPVWWSYAKAFDEMCVRTPSDSKHEKIQPQFSDDRCIEKVYQHVGLDGQAITNCMDYSGGAMWSSGTNNKLKNELDLQRHYGGIHVVPALFVNGVPLDETPLTPERLFRVVCNHYRYSALPRDSTERHLCHKCGPLECTDFLGCILNDGFCPDLLVLREATSVQRHSGSDHSAGVSIATFISSILLLVTVTVGVAVWHYQQSRLHLRRQVQGIVSDYILLENNHDQDNDHNNNDNSLHHDTNAVDELSLSSAAMNLNNRVSGGLGSSVDP